MNTIEHFESKKKHYLGEQKKPTQSEGGKSTIIKGQRITGVQQDILREFGLVRMSSDWTTGRGKWRQLRTFPVFAHRISARDVKSGISPLKGLVKKEAEKLVKQHPNCRSLIAITDLRSADKALKWRAPCQRTA